MNQDVNNTNNNLEKTSSFGDLSFQNSVPSFNGNNINSNEGIKEMPELLDIGDNNNQSPVIVQPNLNVNNSSNQSEVLEPSITPASQATIIEPSINSGKTEETTPTLVSNQVDSLTPSIEPVIVNPEAVSSENVENSSTSQNTSNVLEPTIVTPSANMVDSSTSDSSVSLISPSVNVNESQKVEANIPQPVVVQADSFQEETSVDTNIPVFTPTVTTPNVDNVSSDSNTQLSATTLNATPRDTIGIPTMKTMPNNDGSVPTISDVENLKKVEVEYKPPSKFKLFLLIVFFVGLIAFVMFLPEIKEYVEAFQNRGKTTEVVKITTGRLTCSLTRNTKTLDIEHELVFKFTDNKLEKTEFSITTKGDPTSDEKELNELEASCKVLEKEAESLEGLYVKCSNKTGVLTEIQNMDLAVLDLEKLDSAFVEAGATNPEYKYQQDVDTIEKQMNASGYTCKRAG